MSTNLRPLAVLFRVTWAGASNAAINEVALTVASSSRVVGVGVRSALTRLEERRRSRPLLLTAVVERIVADWTRTFVCALDPVGEEGLVAACHYLTGAGTGDGDGVALNWRGFSGDEELGVAGCGEGIP